MDTGVIYGPGVLLEEARPSSGRQWALSGDRLKIGRDPSSDVFLDDPGASRHHADLIRIGSNWSVVDAGSLNGTFVNGARVNETTLRPGDRIQVGDTELILRQPGEDPTDYRAAPQIRYDVQSQAGNISNIARDQNLYQSYYQESNLRYIGSMRGRARRFIIWGLVLFFVGQGLLMAAVLAIQGSVIDAFNNASFRGPSIPPWFLGAVGLGGFITLMGIALFIFGLVARSGAKREAHNRGVHWS